MSFCHSSTRKEKIRNFRFELACVSEMKKCMEFSTEEVLVYFFYPYEPQRRYKEGEGEYEPMTYYSQHLNLNH